jgi:hypothetical protein
MSYAGAGGIVYQRTPEESIFGPISSTSASNREENATRADSFMVMDSEKADPPIRLTRALLAQPEPPTVGKGIPPNQFDRSAITKSDPRYQFDRSSIGTTDAVSQTDVSPISEGVPPTELDQSLPGMNERDSPAQLEYSTLTKSERTTQDALSTISKGDLSQEDDRSASVDVDSQAPHALASESTSDATAESDPGDSRTPQLTATGDPPETLATDTLWGATPSDPTTLVPNSMRPRKS